MAVTFSAPRPGRNGVKNSDHTRSYSRTYQAKSSAGEEEAAVLDAAIVHFGDVGTPHPVDEASYLTSIRVGNTNRDGTDWSVELDYGPFQAGPSSPLLEPPEIDWGSVNYQAIADRDREGNPIVNSAGDPYDPGIVRDDSRPVLTITRNEATFSPGLADLLRDTVNQGPGTFFGAAAGCVKCKSITGKIARSPLVAGGIYWVVTYVFEFNRDGWASRPLDIGFRRIVSGERKQIFIDGQPATSPVPLDGSGQQLTVGDPPVFLSFHIYPDADYSVFAFPGA